MQLFCSHRLMKYIHWIKNMMDIKWQTYFDFNDTDTILRSKLRITYTYWSYSTEITRFDYWAELYYQTAWCCQCCNNSYNLYMFCWILIEQNIYSYFIFIWLYKFVYKLQNCFINEFLPQIPFSIQLHIVNYSIWL